MRYVLGIIIVVLAVSGAIAAPLFVHGPYSGAPAKESVVISWLASEQVSARIEYAPQSEYDASGTFSSWVETQVVDEDIPVATEHVTLSGLDANTAFVYRVILADVDGDVASPLGHFVTEPPPGAPVEFAILADTQWQWEGENRLAPIGDAIADDSMAFDFILHAGDLVETPGGQIWDHWFQSFEGMLLRAPFLPVLGNHEAGNRSYYNNFALPPGDGKKDKRWWAFHWGDVVIVGLDTDVTKAADYIAQQDWARLHLSGNEPHKIVMFHYPVYSSDAYHGSGYSLDIIFHPIFVETGVDLVINGHAHNYERIQSDGITYLVVGGGGAVPRGFAETPVPESVLAVEGYNFYLRVIAAAEGITVETVSIAKASDESFELTDGHLLDAFVLPTHVQVVSEGARASWLLLLIGLLGAAAAALLLLRVINR